MSREKEHPKSYLGLPVGTLNAATAERARKILRELWHQRSWQKKVALARATDAEGFQVCESCKRRAPKVQVDHIVKCGEPDAEFLQRLFIDPALLRVLCIPCHGDKTWCERLDLFAYTAKREPKVRRPRKASKKRRHPPATLKA